MGLFVLYSGCLRKVKFMAEDKKNAAWWADIKRRALKTMQESRQIMKEVDDNYAKICKFVNDYTEEKLEAMEWEQKEKMYAEADALFQRIAECEEILKRMDTEYESLRQEVNKFYGKEVMKDVPRKDVFDAMREAEEAGGESEGDADKSDWWKKN